MSLFRKKNPVRDELRKARERYGSAPSHASVYQIPRVGTYCILTAFTRHDYNDHTLDAIERMRQAVGGDMSLVSFNATHTTEEVLALFDRAIQQAGA